MIGYTGTAGAGANTDAEVEALRIILAELECLEDDSARRRVLRYLVSRFVPAARAAERRDQEEGR